MPYNLIEQQWIPIRRADGTCERIAPWQITDCHADEQRRIVALAAPRPDFNGALIQFLIGLVQTTMPPHTNEEWRACLKTPPNAATLRAAFQTVAHAFNLDGDGPRFMQDFDLRESTENATPISALLMDAPGEQTEKFNKDFFVKRGFADSFCYSCSANALFTLQTNVPSGGQGHRTSLRGGGPLSTILLGQTPWETVLMNVVCKNEFDAMSGNPSLAADDARFPWLAETRTSQKNGGVETTPLHGHPTQMYWAMPRRIRLNTITSTQGICQLCGHQGDLCNGYLAQNYGVNYTGAWQHPLSPYGRNTQSEPFALHPKQGGITYRHWVANVYGDQATKVSPAAVFNAFRKRFACPPHLRVFCFGYEMDNMKAISWCETIQPYFELEESARAAFTARVAKLRDAAVEVHGHLLTAFKKALLYPKQEAKGGSIFHALSAEFWHTTEAAFYACVNDLKDVSEPQAVNERWLKTLQQAALDLFDGRVNTSQFETMDIKRAVLARNDLRRNINSKKLREKILQLPPVTSHKKRRIDE